MLRLDRRAKGQPPNALPSHEGNFGGTLRDRAVRRMVVPSRQPRLPARTGLASVAFVLGRRISCNGPGSAAAKAAEQSARGAAGTRRSCVVVLLIGLASRVFESRAGCYHHGSGCHRTHGRGQWCGLAQWVRLIARVRFACRFTFARRKSWSGERGSKNNGHTKGDYRLHCRPLSLIQWKITFARRRGSLSSRE